MGKGGADESKDRYKPCNVMVPCREVSNFDRMGHRHGDVVWLGPVRLRSRFSSGIGKRTPKAVLSRSGNDQILACPEIAPALDELQRPEPTQGLVEAPAVRLVSGSGDHLPFTQSVGINLRERLQNQTLRLSQPTAPVVDKGVSSGQWLPYTQCFDSSVRNREPVPVRPESAHATVGRRDSC